MKNGRKLLWTGFVFLALNFALSCGSGITVHTEQDGQYQPATGRPASENQAPDQQDSPADSQQAVEKEKMIIAAAANLGDTIGSLAAIKLDDAKTARTEIALLDSGDAVVASDGLYVYVLNRGGAATVQVFDPNNGLEQLADYSVGPKTNPYDIATVGNKAYISRYEAFRDDDDSSDILIVNKLTGKRIGGIDLKPYMADDGNRFAYAGRMELVGRYLYVLCQDLPGDLPSWWVPDTNGKVVVIDTDTDKVKTVIQLEGWNPENIVYSKGTGKLYVTDTGTYDISDGHGGLEVIDEATGQSEGIKMDDALFGSAVSEVRIASPELGYLIATPYIVSFDPSGFTIRNATFYQSNYAWYLPDFEVLDGGAVAVADVDMQKGGVYFVGPDGKVASGPVSVGSATPYSIEVVEVIKR